MAPQPSGMATLPQEVYWPDTTIVAYGAATAPTDNPEQLTEDSVSCFAVLIQSDDGESSNGNSGVVYIGKSDLDASNGIVLRSGGSIALSVSDPSDIYIFGSAADEVRWMALGPVSATRVNL